MNLIKNILQYSKIYLKQKLQKSAASNLLKSIRKRLKLIKLEDPVIRINETIDAELNMAFKDFFIRGGIAFDGLIKLAGFMGYNISFAFSNEKKYLEKREKFLSQNSDNKYQKFCEMIDGNRKAWHSTFIKIRDAIEHDGFKLPEIEYVLDKDDNIKPIYPTINSQRIEIILEICWINLFHLCEDIIVFLLSTKLRDPLIIISIPEDKRDPSHPVKYKVTIKNLPTN